MDLRQRLQIDLADEEYRHAYADEQLNLSIGTQIKVVREQQRMTQAELAQKIGTKQAGISRLESANYNGWSIAVLRRLAKAFDLRLRVTFEEFGTLWKEVGDFNRQSLERKKFEDDPEFKEAVQELELEETVAAATPIMGARQNLDEVAKTQLRIGISRKFEDIGKTGIWQALADIGKTLPPIGQPMHLALAAISMDTDLLKSLGSVASTIGTIGQHGGDSPFAALAAQVQTSPIQDLGRILASFKPPPEITALVSDEQFNPLNKGESAGVESPLSTDEPSGAVETPPWLAPVVPIDSRRPGEGSSIRRRARPNKKIA